MRESLARLRRRLGVLLHRRAVEREMDEEMRLHVELEAAELVRAGVPAGEARRRARLAFGGVERFKEEARDGRGTRWLEDLARDLHYAVRALRRSPGVTAAAIASIMLGIAATTAVVSATRSLLFAPIPVEDAERLVTVHEWRSDGTRSTDVGQELYEYEHYLAYRDFASAVFDGTAAARYAAFSLRAGDDARTLSGVVASDNYFRVLGVRPALGRFFTNTGDARPHAESVVVVGYDFWQRELDGASTAIGRTLHVDGRPLTVVGVAPRGFRGTLVGIVADVWVPVEAYRLPPPDAAVNDSAPRRQRLTIFGRLRTGTSAEQGAARLSAIAPHFANDDAWTRIERVALEPYIGMPAMGRGPFALFFGVLGLTAGLVLLIAATNVAGILLARATYRQREIAVRLSLGAPRRRIARQLLLESVLLCVMGGTAGVLLTAMLVRLMPAIQPPTPLRVELAFTLDTSVLLVVLGATLTASLVAGFAPALRGTRPTTLAALRGPDAGQPRRHGRLRARFVVAQLAASLVLLIVAGLFVRSLRATLAVDPGLDAAGVMTAALDLAPHGYDAPRARQFFAQLRERLATRPEIAAVAFGYSTPFGMSYDGESMLLPGEPARGGRRINITMSAVDPGYIPTVRMPLLAGRNFDDADRPEATGATPVAIVNETFARRTWPNASPLGQTLQAWGTRTVVGVLRDGRYRNLTDSLDAFVLVPLAQAARTQTTVFLRGSSGMDPALTALREELGALDRDVALAKVMPLEQQIDIHRLAPRVAAWFIGALGVTGLVLATLGVYSVLAYHVAQRRREFGIRIAVGARAADVRRLVLRQGLRLVLVGTAVGLALAAAVGRLVARFLYGVGAADPVVFTAVPLLLAAIALLASWIPAHRATRTDPIVALRVD